MATRAEHYVWATNLVWKAREASAELVRGDSLHTLDRIRIDLMAAQVHATLAAAGPGVEQEVRDNERAVSQALGAAEGDQRARQAARRQATLDLAEAQRAAEETAGTVRPKPGPHVATGCRCGRPVGAHQRGAVGCAHEVSL